MPTERRPQSSRRTDIPWISDDAVVARAMELLPEPVRYLFYLCNRCGLRTGEACGLRMSDLDEMGTGTIRVRFSYLGPAERRQGGAWVW